MVSKIDLKEEISIVAYEIYKKRGTPGQEEEDWLEAERIVLERLSVQSPFKEDKKLAPPRKKGGMTRKIKVSGTEV
jgi:hypothetical protein